MSGSSPEAFAAAVDAYRFDDVRLDPATVELAAATLAEAGLLLVGEPHGVRETPAVLYALAVALGVRAVALEWSHEEMDVPLQGFLRSGTFDFQQLWALPPAAEFFCGDGRITAGHFALLRRLREEERLGQVIAFDRLDPDPLPEWEVRDRELAERLLREWSRRLPLLVVAGAFHARLDVPGTMASRLATELPALRPAMLQYADRPSMPQAPIVLRLPPASPAVVPGR